MRACLAIAAGFMAFTPDSLFRHVVTGAVFAVSLLDLVLVITGWILLRRAARSGRLKGRHSVTGRSLDL
ncbi:hypothetical protein [Kitasatospora sp. NPDC057015]|uniref:hypothetical protein n=1 Tax=Kitasatospora sp. NPDC057015 TaxID=3346001 RepID=UPI00363B9CDE